MRRVLRAIPSAEKQFHTQTGVNARQVVRIHPMKWAREQDD